jgi:hypothetical protein
MQTTKAQKPNRVDVFGEEKISKIEKLLEEDLLENSGGDIYDLEIDEQPEDLILRIHAYSSATEADCPFYALEVFDDAYTVFKEIFGEEGINEEFNLEYSIGLSIEYTSNQVSQIEELAPGQIEKIRESDKMKDVFRKLYEEVN